jgi:hypothetical protein
MEMGLVQVKTEVLEVELIELDLEDQEILLL